MASETLHIRIYTTPTLTFTVKNRDISEFDHIYVTISDHTGRRIVTKKDTDLTVTTSGSNTIVVVTLTQNETKMFKANTEGSAEINCVNSAGTTRPATKIYPVVFENNLLKEVLP